MTELTGLESIEQVVQMKKDLSAHPLLVSRQTLARLVERFEVAALTESELSCLAEALDVAEEVQYEPGYEDLVGQVLFDLSSPEINGPLTQSKCAELLSVLKAPHQRGSVL
jgi:hypothetical protein